MKIISIANQKGGVAKTSTAVNLSASLAVLGIKVLLIDIDPQANATVGSGKSKLLDKISGGLLSDSGKWQEYVLETDFGYHLSNASQELIATDVELSKTDGGILKLKNALNKMGGFYDFVIIDCPPSINSLTLSALTASNGVLIPMQCEYYAMEGIADLLKTIEDIRSSTNKDLGITGILRTMFDARTSLSKDVSQQLAEHFGEKLFNTIIARNISIAEAPSHGMPVTAYQPKSTGSFAYIALAEELLKREKFLKN
jgi:chromosome partitioning protein